MKVGDKVILSAVGMERYVDEPINPRNTLGELVEIDSDYDGDFDYYVVWCNGETNVYMRDDLQVIQC